MRLYTPRILSFFLALCPFLAAEAAQPLYSVSGRVTDAATGEPVTGAVVMVKDTYKGTETDMEGRWRLDNLAAGDYTFAVSFISYKSIEVSCRVAADVEGVDVCLESDSEEVEEVVVKARMRSDTEIAMLGTIKAVPQVTSGPDIEKPRPERFGSRPSRPRHHHHRRPFHHRARPVAALQQRMDKRTGRPEYRDRQPCLLLRHDTQQSD